MLLGAGAAIGGRGRWEIISDRKVDRDLLRAEMKTSVSNRTFARIVV